ncbi:MAG: hypothetical protein ACI8UD_003673 [Planctomycetota bacterium]|jgi:hypothetical protein
MELGQCSQPVYLRSAVLRLLLGLGPAIRRWAMSVLIEAICRLV